MTLCTMRRLAVAGAAALAALACVPAFGQAWPAKPVKFVVPFPPGGSVDPLARLVGAKLSDALGQQFVIENRGGASGMIGTEAAARSAGDGYTMLISSSTTTVNLPLLRPVSYDPKSLEPIARLGDAVTGFAIHPAVGVKSFPELIEYCKKNPGKLAFGSSGQRTSSASRSSQSIEAGTPSSSESSSHSS